MRILFGFLLLLAGCKAVPIDPSIPAAQAGDLTMVFAACGAVPSRGLDICRVVEKGEAAEVMRIVMPKDKRVTGEIRVRYKGVVKSYPVTGSVVQIPLRDVIGKERYEREDQGIIQMTGSLRAELPDGVRFTDVLGYAFLVVLGEGYTPMPIDSGNAAWGSTCRVQYSTAGRSALECK